MAIRSNQNFVLEYKLIKETILIKEVTILEKALLVTLKVVRIDQTLHIKPVFYFPKFGWTPHKHCKSYSKINRIVLQRQIYKNTTRTCSSFAEQCGCNYH